MNRKKGNFFRRYGILAGICAAVILALLLFLLLGPLSKGHRYEKKYGEAQSRYLAGEYSLALDALNGAMKLKETEEAYLLMAECHIAQDDPDLAANTLRLAELKFDSDAARRLRSELTKQEQEEKTPEAVPTVSVFGTAYPADTTILSLSQKSITDVSPLTALTELESLTLSDNRITDVSPLAELTGLTYLQLSGNQISDVSALSSLTLLRSLYLDGNQIRDFSALTSMKALRTLSLRKMDIEKKQIEALRAALPDCSIYCDDGSVVETVTLGGETFTTDVTELVLSAKGITDISVLKECTNLKKLDLRDNSITNLDALSGLTELDWLCLWNNEVTDIAPLLPLTKLRYLDLENNEVESLVPLKSLTELEELWLSNNTPKSLSPLADLTKLHRLGLKNVSLTEEDYAMLCGLTELEELVLDKNEISNLDLEALEEALPDCSISHDEPYYVFLYGKTKYRSDETETLSIPGPDEALTSLDGLEHFEKLRTLNVSDNQLTDLGPVRELEKLEDLTAGNAVLYSGGNRFDDLSPLSGLTKLRRLILNNCGVTDVSPLRTLTALRELNLSDNRISDLSPLAELRSLSTLSLDYAGIRNVSALSSLSELRYLSLDGNPITDLTPLYGLKNLTMLYISGCDVTAKDVRALQEALPNCSIGTDLDLTAPEPEESPKP